MKIQQLIGNLANTVSRRLEVRMLPNYVGELNKSAGINIEIRPEMISLLKKKNENVHNFKFILDHIAGIVNQFPDKKSISVYVNKSGHKDGDFYIDIFKRLETTTGEATGDSSFLVDFDELTNGRRRAGLWKVLKQSHDSVVNQVLKDLLGYNKTKTKVIGLSTHNI